MPGTLSHGGDSFQRRVPGVHNVSRWPPPPPRLPTKVGYLRRELDALALPCFDVASFCSVVLGLGESADMREASRSRKMDPRSEFAPSRWGAGAIGAEASAPTELTSAGSADERDTSAACCARDLCTAFDNFICSTIAAVAFRARTVFEGPSARIGGRLVMHAPVRKGTLPTSSRRSCMPRRGPRYSLRKAKGS